MEEKFELLEQVHHDSSMAAYTIEKFSYVESPK